MNRIDLVPIGGLGNRIFAICSAIVYARMFNRMLRIFWFKDKGCNCDVDKLFSISNEINNVTIVRPSLIDFIIHDNPRRKNFWIPYIFQRIIYDRCIYYSKEKILPNYPYFERMNGHKIFFVNYNEISKIYYMEGRRSPSYIAVLLNSNKIYK